MPFYEYQCDKCPTVTTHLRPIAKRYEPLSCPSCGSCTHLTLSKFSTSSGHSDSGMDQPKAHSSKRPSGGLEIKNVHIEGGHGGVVMPAGAQVDMSNVTFKDVKIPIEIRGKSK